MQAKTDLNPSKRLIITLTGTSGSGKGTQGALLSERFNLPHISVGDLFRREAREKTLLSGLNDQFSNYAPDELCVGMICKRLSEDDCQSGFILDGFPRTPGQANVLVRTILRPEDIHIPIYLDVREEFIVERLKDRFICPTCGVQVQGPGFCKTSSCKDVELVHRSEDIDMGKLQSKFKIFNDNKNGILSIIAAKDEVTHVICNERDSVNDIFSRVIHEIDQRISVSRAIAPHQEASQPFYTRGSFVFFTAAVALTAASTAAVLINNMGVKPS